MNILSYIVCITYRLIFFLWIPGYNVKTNWTRLINFWGLSNNYLMNFFYLTQMEQKIKTKRQEKYLLEGFVLSYILSTALKNLKARSHTLTIPQIHADFWPQHEKCSWNPSSSLEYWFLQGFPGSNWRPVRGQIPPVCKEFFRTMLCLLAIQIYLLCMGR